MTDFFSSHRKKFDFKSFVENAILEDLGDGDHTSLSTIPANKKGKMRLLAKEDGVLAGVEAASKILKIIDASIRIKIMINDGSFIRKGDVVFQIEGKVHALLKAERLILNVIQRMSGIASKTAYLQELCKGTKAKVIDTRKTTPGFRFFEKWAVVLGGGANHRYGLYDMILIKDNHIDFAGGISQALTAAQTYLQKNKKRIKIEIETRNINELREALKHGGADRIMLDNYSVADTAKAVKLVNGAVELESSGGITEKNIAKYAACGVNYISVGALTHHIKSLDLSLKAF